MKKRVLFFILLFSAMAAWANANQLTGVRISPPGVPLRVVFTLSDVPKYHVFTLGHPDRIVIDLDRIQLATTLKSIDVKGSAIKAIRAGQYANQLRVVLDLQQKRNVKSDFVGKELVIDFASTGAIPAAPVSQPPQPVATPAPTPSAPAASVPASPTTAKGKRVVSEFHILDTGEASTDTPKAQKKTPPPPRDVVIVIDPGHGGKDPGAIGFKRTREKYVVMSIARELQRQLNRETGIHAILTRNYDIYLPLRTRLSIARKHKADLFIAIHADAYQNPYSAGSSVYALSASGASSEAARWLAEKENYSELGGINLDDKNDVLRSVLIDLSQTGTISLSLQLGSSLLQELGKITQLHHSTVEQARFVVLKSPDIPSLLVESGFISNAKEEERLSTHAYQHQLATAMKVGIVEYFRQYPPPGTRLNPIKVVNN